MKRRWRRAIRTSPGQLPGDEWDAIALSYTSGTTGNPKGVVTHHRGAYLNAVSNILAGNLGQHPVYLWTLPMFHCNGWCFPWTIAAAAGINVCLRKVDPAKIFELIAKHGVTHMCGAPIVYNTLINAPDAPKGDTAQAGGRADRRRSAAGRGARRRREHRHQADACLWPDRGLWPRLRLRRAAGLGRSAGRPARAAQAPAGRALPAQEAVTVLDPETMREVPRDGETIGEVMFRGNIVMKGYLKNEKATQEAFAGGWFHTGDLGVLDEHGYVIIKDRSKDIIISGGENISSVEVEDVLYKHPGRAVRGRGRKARYEMGRSALRLHRAEGRRARRPKPRSSPSAAATCRASRRRRPWCSAPIPKTSTGKIQKFMLRNQVDLGEGDFGVAVAAVSASQRAARMRAR